MYTETIQEDDTWRWYVETIHLYGALNCGQAEATVIDSCSMFLFIKVKLRLDHFHFNSNCHCLPYWWAWPSLWWWSAASYHLCSECVGVMSVDVISVVWVRCGVMGVDVVGVVWVWCGCDECGVDVMGMECVGVWAQEGTAKASWDMYTDVDNIITLSTSPSFVFT